MEPSIQTTFARREIKYFLCPRQQEPLLRALEPYMVPDVHERYSINTIYYDTADWALVRASIQKPLYKEKLRVRSYGVPGASDSVFLEIKKKCLGTVYKRRIVTEARLTEPILSCLLTDAQDGQISREIQWFQQLYRTQPRVFLGYNRQALMGREDPAIRITFDTDLRWRDRELDLTLGDYGSPLLSDDRVLMELKLPGACPMWLARILSENRIYPVTFSKYGTCYQKFILPKAAADFKEAFHIA